MMVMRFRRAAMLALVFVLACGAVASSVSIVHNGRSKYQIVIPDKCSSAVRHAAAELQGHLLKIAGVRLPVVPEKTAGDGPSFLLGPCRRNVDAGLTAQAALLREDGVLIKTIGENIALLGQNERGNLYSVYVLLEKYLGVRFLAGDCTVIPKRSELELPEIDYSYSSPFMYRETLYFDSFPKDIAARQRLNGPFSKCDSTVGGKIDFFPYVHSFHLLIPEKKYFKDHPEYFGLQGGKRVAGEINAQLCLTNPEVLKLAREQVLKWMDEHPGVPVIDVSQNDGAGPCECANCMAVVKEEGSQHGPILRFVNAIADAAASKKPGIWIETLSYAYSLTPPAVTKPRPNVMIRLCHAGCYFHGFEQCKMGADFANCVDRWTSETKRVFIWHYASDFSHYFAPNQNLNGLARDIRFYGTHGVNGVMVQCDYQGRGGELAELRQYLCAQLLWDPERDPMQVREEFCRGYYGEASDAVLEFLRLMDRVSESTDTHAFGAWDPQNTVTSDFCRDALKILGTAQAASRSSSVTNRINKLMLPFWYMQLTYPTKYGLSEADAPTVLKKVKDVIHLNRITHVREGRDSAAPWIAEMEERYGPKPKDIVVDLTHTGSAQTENCADFRVATVQHRGRAVRSVFQHPIPGKNCDATYEVELPAATRLTMKFGTVITNRSTDGVRYSVLANGKELWNETKTVFLSPEPAAQKTAQDNILPHQDPFSFHTLDLSAYAGQKIQLTLRVNALAEGAFDWANWLEPKIVRAK